MGVSFWVDVYLGPNKKCSNAGSGSKNTKYGKLGWNIKDQQ